MSDVPKRNKKGHYTGEGLQGNSYAKKDFTKEMAQYYVRQDLYRLSRIVFDTPKDELESILQREGVKLSLASSALIERIKKNDVKALQFLVEMTVGKAIQQVETTIKDSDIRITIDKDDASL